MKKKWNLFLSDHYPDGYGTGPTGTGFPAVVEPDALLA